MVVNRRAFLGLGAAAGATALVATPAYADPPDQAGPAEDRGAGVLRFPVGTGGAAFRTQSARTQPQVHVRVAEQPFELVGVTWDAGEPTPQVQVRVRSQGQWSDWHALGAGHDPDGDARPGTDPLWVPEADAVDVRADPSPEAGALPAGLSIDLVQPMSVPTSDLSDPDVQGVESADVYYPRPTIHSRESWGADESLRQNQDDIWYGEVRGAFVHHTVTPNGYSRDEVPAILRSIYRYHVLSRDFDDIGYNFLIDRFGRTWEGCYGGVDQPVVGAHTQYYNTQSFGVSAIGSFHLEQPSTPMVAAFYRLIAWKFTVHGISSAYTTAQYTNDGAQPLPIISGHSDTKPTACPGQYLYPQISVMRREVHTRVTAASTLTFTGPPVIPRGQRTEAVIDWSWEGGPLSGAVNVQRLRGDTWEHVRQVRVDDGQAVFVMFPGADNSYRLRISSCDTAGIDRRHPRGTSNTYSTDVLRPGDDPRLVVVGPTTTQRGSRTMLDIYWASPDGLVSGLINLQRQTATGWTHVRQLEIRDGHLRHAIFPGGSNSYRFRASRVFSPSGVPTAHPVGTSNVLSITVT